MIINNQGHIIGQQPNMVNQHGQMVNQQMIQNTQAQSQGQIIQNIPGPGPNMGGNIVSIPNGVNVQMASPASQQVINQEGVHPMIHPNQGHITPPGVKLQSGQVRSLK